MSPTIGSHDIMTTDHEQALAAGAHRPAAPERLTGVDLNLLVALDALLEECHVTRAASRLGVTQSALSHTLRRLRELFADPLLVRAGGTMVPTPRALALAPAVRAGLATLGVAIFEPPVFEPASSSRRFRLVAPDLFDAVALPGLLRRFATEAPSVDLTVASSPLDKTSEALASGDLDIAIVARFDGNDDAGGPSSWPEAIRSRTLFRDHFTCFLRAGHPALQASVDGDLGLDAYTQARHLMVSPTGEGAGLMDGVLARKGRSRRVALRIPHFASAPSILAGSDLILTGPATMTALMGPVGCVQVAPPLEIPGHRVAMLWHQRMTKDPGHRWFREALIEVTAALNVGRDPRAP